MAPTAQADTGPDDKPTLITTDTQLPDDAEDLRGDGILRDSSGRPVTHRLLGERLPDISGQLVGGESIDAADLAGQWTVIVAWGVWCHDSRNDMDNISHLADRLEDTTDVDFLSVHVPYTPAHLDTMYRNHGSVSGYFEHRGVSFPTLLDETGDLRAYLEVDWTPTYLVVAPDLTVRGYRTDLSISGDNAVEAFLKSIQKLRDGL